MPSSPNSIFHDLEKYLQSYLDPWPTALIMAAITGVYIDLKPVAFEHLMSDQIGSLDYEFFRNLLSRLQINFTSKTTPASPPIITWYFSKQPELITDLQHQFDIWHQASDATEDSANRRIGQLLGYPSTAIEFFIQRSHTSEPSSEIPSNQSFYIHSPEHFQSEFDQYEKPLYAAMEAFCPNSFKILMDELSN